MIDVVICCTAEERERLAPLARALREHGWRVARLGVKASSVRLSAPTQGKLAEASAVVVAWTERSALVGAVHDAAEAARARGALVPLLVDPVRPRHGTVAPRPHDLTGWEGGIEEPSWQELARHVEALVLARLMEPPPLPGRGGMSTVLVPVAAAPHLSRADPFGDVRALVLEDAGTSDARETIGAGARGPGAEPPWQRWASDDDDLDLLDCLADGASGAATPDEVAIPDEVPPEATHEVPKRPPVPDPRPVDGPSTLGAEDAPPGVGRSGLSPRHAGRARVGLTAAVVALGLLGVSAGLGVGETSTGHAVVGTVAAVGAAAPAAPAPRRARLEDRPEILDLVEDGWAALDRGRIGAAVFHLGEALERAPDAADAAWGMGLVELRRGRGASARAHLCHAIAGVTAAERVEIRGVLDARGLTCAAPEADAGSAGAPEP